MGYTLTIGELKVIPDLSAALDDDGLFFTAEAVSHEGAPAFGEPTDHSNSRWPSYTAWAETMRDTGLYDVFFWDGTLLGGHPGARLVTQRLRETVSSALASYREAHPVEAEFGTDEGANICRLIWLDYWIGWALENCKTPVIANC